MGCDRLAGVYDDVELLDAWKGGDRRAGAALFERHYPAVLRFFHNKAGDHGKDLIQRTFLRCLEARDRILPGSSFRAYLFGVARNVLLEHFRSVKRDGERVDEMLTTVHDVSPNPTPISLLSRKREVRLLLEALRKIPIELQITLELFYWEGMPAGEIGDAFGVPEGTVRTRLRRARQLLEQEIASIASSPAELHSTMSGLEGWVAQIREEIGQAGAPEGRRRGG
jgi:RNA polymerase sigma factor (sigma-70 family)